MFVVRPAVPAAEHRCSERRARQHDSGYDADGHCSEEETACLPGRFLLPFGRLLRVLSVRFARARERTLGPRVRWRAVAGLGVALGSEQLGGGIQVVVKARASCLLGR